MGGQENTSVEATVQEVTCSCLRSETLLNQHGEAYVHPDWILLDSESSEHLFCNKNNVRETTNGEVLRMHFDKGSLETRTTANLGSIEVSFLSTNGQNNKNV